MNVKSPPRVIITDFLQTITQGEGPSAEEDQTTRQVGQATFRGACANVLPVPQDAEGSWERGANV